MQGRVIGHGLEWGWGAVLDQEVSFELGTRLELGQTQMKNNRIKQILIRQG